MLRLRGLVVFFVNQKAHENSVDARLVDLHKDGTNAPSLDRTGDDEPIKQDEEK